jgi:hypothetical protein
MYNKVFLFSILFFNLLQLNAQYQELKDCINEQVNKNSYILDYEIKSKVDVFDSIEKLENYLLQNKLLKNRDQKSYQDLDKNENIDFEKLYKEFPFLFAWNYEFGYLEVTYNGCFSIVSNNNMKWAEKLWPEKKVYDKIIAQAIVNSSIVNQLSMSIDYRNDISRLMLCNLIFGKWVLDYKEEIFKNKKGGK